MTTALNGSLEQITIPPPKIAVATFTIVGTAPLVINRFSAKAMAKIRETQEAGSQAKSKKTREPKDFQGLFEQSRHISTDGWDGFPAPAIRCACISACRLVGFKMTLAKLSIFVLQNGWDRVDSTPLIQILDREPRQVEHAVRNATGVVDLRSRAMYDPGWRAEVTIRWDQDQFSTADVSNLLARAGVQVGIGEGRPDSRDSAGCGWGTFEVTG